MFSATHLSKSYGGREAVSDVSLRLTPGRVLGLLGPNGAGKSTTVAMLCGLLSPERGEVAFDDGVALTAGRIDAFKRRIGLVPQDLALYEELPARHNLRLFGALYGMHGAALDRRVDAALDLVGLRDRAKDRPSTFSGGMKRRLNIACALVHDPDVLVLDEPTVGIDPQSRNVIFENLETLRDAGKALLYTTHYMEEVERLCERIVIIDHGRVVADDTLPALLRRADGGERIELTVAGDADAALSALAPLSDLRCVAHGAGELRVEVASLAADGARVLGACAEAGVVVRDMRCERRTLEDVFLALTGRQLRDHA
ncbi:MAG: ABC transporter ATP-binding protein [Burkholderiales bacterium]|nr:ABC transporter ATP-binding protein [Burkholderiales bacterium]